MSAELRVNALLMQHGYRLVRNRKHQIWVNPSLNCQIVFPNTPSDSRCWRNALSDLKRQIAGLPTRGTQVRFVMTPELSATFDKTLAKRDVPRPSNGVTRPPKNKGAGFIYEDRAPVRLTPEQKVAKKAFWLARQSARDEKKTRRDAAHRQRDLKREQRRAAKEALRNKDDSVMTRWGSWIAASAKILTRALEDNLRIKWSIESFRRGKAALRTRRLLDSDAILNQQ
jgi:hypothetical protein